MLVDVGRSAQQCFELNANILMFSRHNSYHVNYLSLMCKHKAQMRLVGMSLLLLVFGHKEKYQTN